jgi:hypothetical protein
MRLRSLWLLLAATFFLSTSPASAVTVVVEDDFVAPLLLSHPTHDSYNPVKGTFDLAGALGVAPPDLASFQLTQATVDILFMDDFDAGWDSSFLSNYSLLGQDAQGHNVYERTFTDYYQNDDERDLAGAYIYGVFDYSETSHPQDDFRIRETGLSQDFPSPSWPDFDPNGVYFTRNRDYRPGTRTGYFTVSLALSPDNLTTLGTTGSLEYWAYMIGISTAQGTDLPNDIYLEQATLSVEYTAPVPAPSTALLLASGLLGLASYRRGRPPGSRPL